MHRVDLISGGYASKKAVPGLPRALLLVAVLLPGLTLPVGANSDLKYAIQRAKSEVLTWTLTPKVNVGKGRSYQVSPDGTVTSKKQGKQSGKQVILPGGRVALWEKGVSKRTTWRKIDIAGSKIRIGFRTSVERAQGWSYFEILHDRPIVAADLAPDALARALSGFFEIKGPNLSRGGVVQARLRQVLHPIEVSAKTTRFRDITVSHPPGWQPEVFGQKVVYRTKDSKPDSATSSEYGTILLQSFELNEHEKAAGPELFLSEVLPDRSLASLTKTGKQARLDRRSVPWTVGPFVLSYYDGRAKNSICCKFLQRIDGFHAWLWILDTRNDLAYAFRASVEPSDTEKIRQAMQSIASTLAPATDSVPQLAASRPEAPTPGPVFSDTPTIDNVTVEANPTRVRHGEPLQMILRFDILAPTEEAVPVTQGWTLSFDGSALPTYPTERQITRSRGSDEATLKQIIPSDAPLGVYKLKGEVCVLEDCSSRTTTFEVVP